MSVSPHGQDSAPGAKPQREPSPAPTGGQPVTTGRASTPRGGASATAGGVSATAADAPANASRSPDPVLLERLARLGVRVGTAASGPVASHAHGTRHPARMPIEEAVPGRVVENEGGACYVSELRRGAHETHGGEVIGEARTICTQSLSELTGNAALGSMDPGAAAYLDTETTGLAGSSGTYAFLVGVGKFQGDSFVVRQLFMRSPADEPALLVALEEWLEGCTSLVTFNGRAYDVPLLDGRLRLHRRPWREWAAWPHLDLLHTARRLWGRRLEGCALTDLERRIFGTNRHEDVPGWLVPERYFRYQRDGDARSLVSVFRHNALDVLTMASLLTRVTRTFSDPESWVRHGVDWMSLGAVYERARDPERALSAWGQALTGRLAPCDVRESEWRMALAAKRCGDWDRAAELWTSLVANGAPHAGPYVELAKMHEHQRRSYGAALGYARAARDLVAEGRLERHRRGAAVAELDRRIARLEARCAKDASGPAAGAQPQED